MMEFDATILDIFKNVKDGNKPNIVIFDRSAIYPTSGGQQHDNGLMTIFGKFPEYKSFEEIIRVEYDRWRLSDDESVKKLDGIIKKRKGKLTIDDWI
jgi:Ser-tRNA(Ala) deacylase AlaX